MARKIDKKNKLSQQVINLPEGRLMNNSLFVKDVYTDDKGNEGTPAYKVEMAIDRELVEGEGTIEDHILAMLAEEYGDEIYDEFDAGEIITGLKDGDEYAKKRERNGKDGSAYKGKMIVRANTIFNKDGVDGPGGIQVYDEDVEDVLPTNSNVIFNGCYGIAAVTVKPYVDQKTGYRAATFYLSAFQKTGGTDEDRLVSAQDHSGLFKKVGRKSQDEGGRSDRSARSSRRSRG